MSGTGKIMNLLNDSGPQGRRYKCLIRGTFSRYGICSLHLRDLSHDIPLHRSYNESGRQDGIRWKGLECWLKLARECICFGVFGVTVNWNRVKKRAHLACLWLSLLALQRYSRLRWSVRTEKGNLDPSSQCRHLSKAVFVASCSRFPTSSFCSACVRSRHRGKVWVDCHDVVKGLPLHLCWRHLSVPKTHVQDLGDAV